MSILLVMWAAKQTKKGVTKADTAIKRRSQIRMEKRMTKLGLSNPYISPSLPDLSEDPIAYAGSPLEENNEEDDWDSDPLNLPSSHVLSTLPPDAAEAVAKFVANENEARRSYQVEVERNLMDLKVDLAERGTSTRHTTTVPPPAYVAANEDTYHRASMSEVREGIYETNVITFEGLPNPNENPVQPLKPVKKARHGSRFFDRMSSLRKGNRASEANF